MGLEAEVAALRRQNRNLKLALIACVTLILFGAIGAVTITGVAVARSRAMVMQAIEMEHQARQQAEAAMRQAQQALEEAEAAQSGAN